MTIRNLKEIINNLDESVLDSEVVICSDEQEPSFFNATDTFVSYDDNLFIIIKGDKK